MTAQPAVIVAEPVVLHPGVTPDIPRRRIKHVVHTTADTMSVRFDDIGPTFVVDRNGQVVETAGPPADAVQVDTYEDVEERDEVAGAAAAANARAAIRSAATRRGLSLNTINYLLGALE